MKSRQQKAFLLPLSYFLILLLPSPTQHHFNTIITRILFTIKRDLWKLAWYIAGKKTPKTLGVVSSLFHKDAGLHTYRLGLN